MGMYALLPILFALIYFGIFAGVLYLIYTWVNKFIVLRQEQNDLLREIIKRMDSKGNG